MHAEDPLSDFFFVCICLCLCRRKAFSVPRGSGARLSVVDKASGSLPASFVRPFRSVSQGEDLRGQVPVQGQEAAAFFA